MICRFPVAVVDGKLLSVVQRPHNRKVNRTTQSEFSRGVPVVLTLHSPREKYFGTLVNIDPAGIALRGTGLDSLDDLARQIRAGEQYIASSIFFPMHRVERMELDAAYGESPSLSEQFASRSGRTVQEIFGPGESQ